MNLHARYYFREALASFGRGGAMSLVAVLALTLAAMALGAYALLKDNTHYWMLKAESRFEVVVYFKDGLGDLKVKQLAESLKTMPEVRELSLVSPAEALKELSKDSAVAEVIGVLGAENPLPWSARIKVRAAESDLLKALAARARELEGVSDVDWGQESAEALLKWLKLLKLSLLMLGVALGVSALLVTASVIRLTVHLRREEINIMRMVGASPWFIRIPFLLEGFFQGFSGGALGCLILIGMGRLISARALSELQLDLSVYLPYSVTPLFFAAVCLGTACLGFAGSLLAVGGPFKGNK